MVELGWQGSVGHCMILVTRYLLVGRVENEVNNDLSSSFLGSDRISGLYKNKSWPVVRFMAVTRSLHWIGVMSAFKESDSRFPSRENSLEAVKRP